MGGGKSNSSQGTQYGQSSVSIPPEIMARYGKVWDRAEQAANQPFQSYGGQFVAPTNEEQQSGINTINQAGNTWGWVPSSAMQQVSGAQQSAQPYLNAAGGNLTDALSQGQGLSNASLGMGMGAYGQAQPYNMMARGQVNTGYGNTGAYNQTAAGLAGAGTAAVNAGPLDTSSFLSPYQDQVIKATMAQLGQQQAQQRADTRDDMILGGSFGGDRAGIANANLVNQQNLASASTLAGLNQANYAQALGAAQQQQGVNLGAQQANRAAIQQGAGMFADLGNTQFNQALGAANANLGIGQQQYGQGMGLAGLQGQMGQQIYGMGTGTAQAQQGLGLASYNMGANTADAYSRYGQQGFNNQLQAGQAMLGAGTLQQQTSQADLSARYNQFLQQQGYPFQVAQFLSNIATGSGPLYGSSTSSSSGQFAPQPYFSDERVKENIKEIGRTHDGQKIIKFNFRGDNQPQIGLSAQDVEKHHPDAVGEYHGIKTVDYDEATRDAERTHRAMGGGLGDIVANQKAMYGTLLAPGSPGDPTAGGPLSPGTPVAPGLPGTGKGTDGVGKMMGHTGHPGGLLGAAMAMSGSANGATGNDSGTVGNAGDGTQGGVSGTGGVGGSASSESGVGGSAAAGVGGDDGGTYERGGRAHRDSGGAMPYSSRMEPTGIFKLPAKADDRLDPAMGLFRGISRGDSVGDILTNTGGMGDPMLSGLGGILKGDSFGTIAGNMGKSALGPAGGFLDLFFKGGRVHRAGGGGIYGQDASASPFGDVQGLIMAHNAMYGGMNPRAIPGMGGAGGGGPTGIVPTGGTQRTPKLLTPPQQAQQPQRQQQTGLQQTMGGANDLMSAGKTAASAYSTGKDALVGSAGTKDNPATGGLLGHGGSWDTDAGWLGRNLGWDTGGQMAGDIGSIGLDNLAGAVYFKGGRVGRAYGGETTSSTVGSMPYDGVSILPEDLFDPEAPSRLPQAPDALQARAGQGGAGGKAKSNIGKTVGPLAGAAVGSIIPGVGTMIGGMAGGLLGGMADNMNKGGRVGFADGGSGTGGFGEIPLDAVIDPSEKPSPFDIPFTGLRNEKPEVVEVAKPNYEAFGKRDAPRGGDPNGFGAIAVPQQEIAAKPAPVPDMVTVPATPPPSVGDVRAFDRSPVAAQDAPGALPQTPAPALGNAAAAAGAQPLPAPQAVSAVPGQNPEPPRPLVQRILGVESGNSHWDADGQPKLGTSGERGVGQIMPGTGPIAAKDAGVPWNEELFYRRKTGDKAKDEEAENYHRTLATGHINALLQRYGGDETKAAAAYNAGAGAVDKAIARSGDRWLSDPAIPASTRDRYLPKVAAGVNSDPGAGNGRQDVMSLNAGQKPGLGGAGDAAGTSQAPVPGQGGFGAANPSAMSLWGKAGDWLDRNERYVVPGLAFLGNMLASPSRTLAGSIGSGLAAAAPLYANLGQKQQQLELGRTQAETARINTQLTERSQLISVLAQLQQRQKNLMNGNGGVPDPNLAAQIAAVQAKITGGGGLSNSPMPGGAAGRTDLTPAGGPTPSVAPSPAAAGTPSAASPAPPAAAPTANRWAIPDLQPPDWSKVDDDYNPELLKKKAQAISRETGEDPQPYLDRARAAQLQFQQTGELPAKGGGTVRSPNWEQVQQARANIPTNRESTLQEQQAAAARQDARRQINAMRDIMQNYETGTWNDVKATIAGRLAAVGLKVPDAATINPVAFQEFMKGAYTNILNTASTIKGANTDELRQQISGATPSPDLQPAANRKLLGQLSATLDQADKHYTDWSRQVKEDPATNKAVWYDEWQKKPENNLEDMTKKAIHGTPVLGDAPARYTDIEEGKQYILRPAEAKQLGYNDEQIKRAFGSRKTIKVIGTKNADGQMALSPAGVK